MGVRSQVVELIDGIEQVALIVVIVVNGAAR